MTFPREQIRNLITQLIKPLRNRVYTMITRTIVESVKDTDGMQVIKASLLAGENRDEVEHFQNYGHTSNPPDASECIALSVGGSRDHLLIIAVGDRNSRLIGLAKGESAIYNGLTGDHVILKANGDLDARLSGDFKVDMSTGTLDLTLSKVKMSNGVDEYTDLLVQTLTALSGEPLLVNAGTFATLAAKLTAFKA